MREIERGIFASDELILLLSESSIRSQVVQREIEIAQSFGKSIRPILIGPITSSMPQSLKSLHYLEFPTDADTIAQSVPRFLVSGNENYYEVDQADFVTLIKKNCCRSIWPIFDEMMLSSGHQAKLLQLSAVLNRLSDNYPTESLLLMNAGLVNCLVGAWDNGISQLRLHAEASRRLAGWYMYALHLNSRRHVSSIDPSTGERVLAALNNAESIGRNPLCTLLKIIYEFGYGNVHSMHLESRMGEIESAHASGLDVPTEYLRFFWCMGQSLDVLRQYRSPVFDFIKRLRQSNG
jgi:hypothetical protein